MKTNFLAFKIAGNFLFSDRNANLGFFSDAVFNLSRNVPQLLSNMTESS